MRNTLYSRRSWLFKIYPCDHTLHPLDKRLMAKVVTILSFCPDATSMSWLRESRQRSMASACCCFSEAKCNIEKGKVLVREQGRAPMRLVLSGGRKFFLTAPADPLS